MKKELLYLLLPLCVSLLPACSKTYTLTLVNTDKLAGTIISKDGKYKAGKEITLEVETKKGYKFNYWKDAESNNYYSEQYLTFTMPASNVTLSANFECETYNFAIENKVVVADGCYDFKELIDEGISLVSYHLLHSVYYRGYEGQHKYKTELDIKLYKVQLDDELSFLGFYNDKDEYLGNSEIQYKIPNRDSKVYGKVYSQYRAVEISTSVEFVDYICTGLGNPHVRLYDGSGYTPEYYFLENNKEYTVSIIKHSDDWSYEFDYWLDLTTNTIATTSETLTIPATGALHRYKSVYHKK